MSTQQAVITANSNALESFINDEQGLVRNKVIDQVDHLLINTCIGLYGNNQIKISEVLGVSRGTLRKRMVNLGFIQ